MGFQKPIEDVKEIVRKEQSPSDLIEALSSKVKPEFKVEWDVGSFEASSEITPKSLKSFMLKLERVCSDLNSSIEEDVKGKKNSDNYKQVVNLTSYCLEILKIYGK